MYCKNCGKEVNDNQAICLECGTKVGEGNAYCSNCGQSIDPNASVCTNCGVAVVKPTVGTPKKKIVALLLAIFLGQLGIHNFYLGYTSKGIIQLVVTLVFCWTFVAPVGIWIWAIVEGIKANNGELPDANGNALID